MIESCILVDLKFKWGRHCSVVRSIAHCAVDRACMASATVHTAHCILVHMH